MPGHVSQRAHRVGLSCLSCVMVGTVEKQRNARRGARAEHQPYAFPPLARGVDVARK